MVNKIVEIVEGEPAKPFKVYRLDIDNNPYECEGEYDTVAEVQAHNFHLGARQKILVGRKYYSKAEFDEWVRQQSGGPNRPF